MQIELDDDSKVLATINPSNGLYNYNRLLFGSKPAVMLANFSFAFAYLDDIVVVNRSTQEHYEHLQKVFEVIADYGFRVFIYFSKSPVTYLGNIFKSMPFAKCPSPTATNQHNRLISTNHMWQI